MAPETRARTRLVGRDLDRAPHPGYSLVDAVHRARALRRDARDVADAADPDRTDRSDRGHQLRDIDRHFRGGGGWLDRGVRIRPQLAGPHPPEEPPSAPARPLAARRTGRAALPSATFPHHLPAVRQISWPLQLSTSHRRNHIGAARHLRIYLHCARKLAVLQRYSISRVAGYPPDSRRDLRIEAPRSFSTLRVAYAREPSQTPCMSKQSNKTVKTKPAVPTGFEPAVSSLTGTHVRPLHHGTNRDNSTPVHPEPAQPLPLNVRLRPALPGAAPTSGRHASFREYPACCRWCAASRRSARRDSRA